MGEGFCCPAILFIGRKQRPVEHKPFGQAHTAAFSPLGVDREWSHSGTTARTETEVTARSNRFGCGSRAGTGIYRDFACLETNAPIFDWWCVHRGLLQ